MQPSQTPEQNKEGPGCLLYGLLILLVLGLIGYGMCSQM